MLQLQFIFLEQFVLGMPYLANIVFLPLQYTDACSACGFAVALTWLGESICFCWALSYDWESLIFY